MTRLTDRQMSPKSLCVMSEVSLSVYCGVSICWRSLWKQCVFIYLHGHDRVWREKLRMSVEVGLCDHHWSKNNKREGSCYICFCVSMHEWYEENTRCKKPFVVTCSKVWWCFVRFELKRRCASMFFITDVANFHPLVILGLPDHLSKNIWGNNCQHLPDGCR